MKEQSSTKQASNLVEMRLQTIINLLLRDNFMCSSKRMIMLGWRKIKTTKVLLLEKQRHQIQKSYRIKMKATGAR